MYELRSGGYYEVGASLAFPALSAGRATQFLSGREQTRYAEWVRRVRAWARSQAEAGS